MNNIRNLMLAIAIMFTSIFGGCEDEPEDRDPPQVRETTEQSDCSDAGDDDVVDEEDAAVAGEQVDEPEDPPAGDSDTEPEDVPVEAGTEEQVDEPDADPVDEPDAEPQPEDMPEEAGTEADPVDEGGTSESEAGDPIPG